MLQDKKLWVDSLGVCYQRLLSTTYVAVPETAQAKGEKPHTQFDQVPLSLSETSLTAHLV